MRSPRQVASVRRAWLPPAYTNPPSGKATSRKLRLRACPGYVLRACPGLWPVRRLHSMGTWYLSRAFGLAPDSPPPPVFRACPGFR
eukprot:6345499-Lingulodinium_polyedra.AAC.1